MPTPLATYAAEVARLAESPTTAEETYYGAISTLLTTLLKEEKLPSDVRTNTKEKREGTGLDRPDLAVYSPDGEGIILPVEVKTPRDDARAIALGTGTNDQVGRYLARNRVALVTNVRTVVLVTVRENHPRDGNPVPPDARTIAGTVDLLTGANAGVAGSETELAALLETALTDYVVLSDPQSLARVLARQARRAKAALPTDFSTAVEKLRADFAEALGVTFAGEDDEEFFRSSLIQTIFYGVFAAWTIGRTEDQPRFFHWTDVGTYLPIPFVRALFYEIVNPSRLGPLGIKPYLDAAEATLARVDEARFFARMRPPSMSDDEDPEIAAASAITYFYEPFLEAFDPKLREDLGVWYTPPEIVRYQVEKVHALLKSELGYPLGLADPNVVILDPCCGTGAYLMETLHVIARTLKVEGTGANLGAKLRKAVHERVIGFEILTAPFVIAHLQIHLLLRSLGATPKESDRPAVYLTNALTGWNPATEPVKLAFPEIEEERDAARRVKREAKVIVIIGNPPYNRFAGEATKEEQALVDHYKGIKRVTKTRNNKVTGNPEIYEAQKGQGRLFSDWGIRKSLLDDLYIRFFRLAEERIGVRAEKGIVCFISNSSFLTGRSHPIMRESLLRSFREVWIDNLNGDKYKTGKTIPAGLPDAGTSDQSIFTTDADPRGIQVGAAITTWLKTGQSKEPATVHYRDLYGLANAKRAALTGNTAPAYRPFDPTRSKRYKLVPYEAFGGYEDWPNLDELFPRFSMGLNANRGLEGAVIGMDRQTLADRFTQYFSPMPWDQFAKNHPVLALPRSRYDPPVVRAELNVAKGYDESRLLPYAQGALDLRTIYYEDEAKLISERSPDVYKVLEHNEFLLAVSQPRRVSEARLGFATTLYNLHYQDRGTTGFFAEAPATTNGSLNLGNSRKANLAPSAWTVLRDAYALSGDLEGDHAKALVRRLFRAALALGHSPAFERDHRESLAQDWLHLPIPRDPAVLDRLNDAGDRIAILLDPLKDPREVLIAELDARRTKLGVPRTVTPTDAFDPTVTYSYFGGGKGRYELAKALPPQRIMSGEVPEGGWGNGENPLEPTGRLYLNPTSYLDDVPERVWRYELGGYPVLKKWLGYRDARRRPDTPLSDEELDHLTGIVRRLAALLTLHPTLDALYAETIASTPFTVEELGLR